MRSVQSEQVVGRLLLPKVLNGVRIGAHNHWGCGHPRGTCRCKESDLPEKVWPLLTNGGLKRPSKRIGLGDAVISNSEAAAKYEAAGEIVTEDSVRDSTQNPVAGRSSLSVRCISCPPVRTLMSVKSPLRCRRTTVASLPFFSETGPKYSQRRPRLKSGWASPSSYPGRKGQ